MTQAKPRIGFFLFNPVIQDGGELFFDGSIFNMLRYFPAVFTIDMVCPVIPGPAKGNPLVNLDMTFHPIPGWEGGRNLYLSRFPSVLKAMWNVFSKSGRQWQAVWIAESDPLGQIVFLIAKMKRLPAILYFRGNARKEMLARHNGGGGRLLAQAWCRWLRVAIPAMLRRSAAVFAGKALYDEYSSYTAHPTLFYSTSVRMEDVRERLKPRELSAGRSMRALYVGNLVKYKRVDRAILAVKSARGKGTDVCLDVVGDGPELENLRRMALDIGVGESIAFHGFVRYDKTLFGYYERADVFVLPSETEGSPKVVSEALSFGLPVIATAVGGVPEMIKDHENGIFVEDELGIAEAFEELARSPELYAALSRSAFNSAFDFTIERQLQRLQGLGAAICAR